MFRGLVEIEAFIALKKCIIIVGNLPCTNPTFMSSLFIGVQGQGIVCNEGIDRVQGLGFS